MHATALVGEHMCDENALIDLQSFLGDLFFQCTLCVDLLAGRQQGRKALGRVIDHFGDAQGQGAILGNRVVHRGGVAAEKGFLGLAHRLSEDGAVRARALDYPRGLREIALRGFGVLLERCVETRALRKAWQPRLGRRIHVRVLFCRPYFWYNDVLLNEFRHLLSIPAGRT